MLVVGLAFCCAVTVLPTIETVNGPFPVRTREDDPDLSPPDDGLRLPVCRAGHGWTVPGPIPGAPSRHLLSVPALVRLSAPRRGERERRHPQRRRCGRHRSCERQREHRAPVHVARASTRGR